MTLATSESPNQEVRDYIMENAGLTELDDNCDIFETGVVNSLFAIELMTFLEGTFSIKVTMEDLDMSNFSSVNATCEFIKRKQAGA